MFFEKESWSGLATTAAIAMAAVTFAPTVRADEEPHGGDFELTRVNDKLTLNTSVLGAEMALTGGVYYTDEPGFDSPTDAFDVNSAIGFNILSPLGLWNGSGFSDLNPATNPVLNISNTVGLTTLQANTSTGFVSGYTLNVGPAGEWHKHLNFNLLGNGGDTSTLAADGIYLLELELKSTQGGVFNSDPFFIVFNNGGLAFEEDHEAAIEWAEANLVPEPASALILAGLGGLAMIHRRRNA